MQFLLYLFFSLETQTIKKTVNVMKTKKNNPNKNPLHSKLAQKMFIYKTITLKSNCMAPAKIKINRTNINLFIIISEHK